MIVMLSPGHGYKHIQHLVSQRRTATNIFNTWLAGTTVSSIPHPVAVAVVGLLTIAGKTGADGVKLHKQWLNDLLLHSCNAVDTNKHCHHGG